MFLSAPKVFSIAFDCSTLLVMELRACRPATDLYSVCCSTLPLCEEKKWSIAESFWFPCKQTAIHKKRCRELSALRILSNFETPCSLLEKYFSARRLYSSIPYACMLGTMAASMSPSQFVFLFKLAHWEMLLSKPNRLSPSRCEALRASNYKKQMQRTMRVWISSSSFLFVVAGCSWKCELRRVI